MSLIITNTRLGMQPVLTVSSTQNHAMATEVGFYDTNSGSAGQGAGTLIYLQGAANTIQGSVVTYNSREGSTTLLTATTGKNTGFPLAVAMAAINSVGSWGWYQTSGCALVAKDATDFPTANSVYLSATAGKISVTAASGNQVQNAITANSISVASTTTTIYVNINRPSAQGAAG